jgi:hypothetical protein
MADNLELIPYSWNGNLINDWWWSGAVPKTGNYSSWFPFGQRANLHAQATYAPVAYSFPRLSASTPDGHSITIRFGLKSGNTIAALRKQISAWFDVNDFQPHVLIAKDAQGTPVNRQWYLSGIATDVVQVGEAELDVTLALIDPIWRVVTASTSGNVAVTTNPKTVNLTLSGSLKTAPIITITPNNPRTGSYGYKRYIPIYNATASPFPFGVSSVDILPAGLDTAALVAGGKMLASGNDCRVFVDGGDRDRWVGGGGWNSTTTHLWCNIPHSVGAYSTININLPNNGTLVAVGITKNAGGLALLNRLARANNKAFIIGNEVFTFTSAASIDLVNYRVINCNRAQKGTSFAAHSIGDAITWIEHDVWLMYGNAAAAAPDIDDTNKPMLDLVNSRNTSFVWTGFFDRQVKPRPLMWKPKVASSVVNGLSKQYLSVYYTGDASAGGAATIPNVNPSIENGLIMQTWTHNAVPRAETANLFWDAPVHPAGYTTSSVIGKKYLAKLTVWPIQAGLYVSSDGATYSAVWNEAKPTLLTWTAFTHNSVSLGGTFKYVRQIFAGSIAAASGNQANIQYDTITLAVGANRLTVSTNAEQDNYHLTATITNNTSGEYITLTVVMGTAQTLTLDCGAKTCTLDDGTNEFNAVALSDGRINPDWLDIGQDTNNNFTGAASIIIASSGVANETWNITWKDQAY